MPAFFENIMGAMGVPDPYDELKAYSAAQAAKEPRCARRPSDLAPGVTAASDAAPPVTTLPPQQTPNAVKTPQDMGSIMVDLQRRKEAEQGWNQAVGMGFGAFAQPRNREAVSKMFNVDKADPMKFGEAIMGAASAQQGQDRANAIGQLVNDPVKGPQIAAKMGMDWGMLKAGILTDPGMIGQIAKVLGTPTEGQRNLGAAQAAIEKQVRLEHPDWTDAQVQAEVNRQAPPSMLLSGIGNLDDQAYRRYATDEQAAGRTPLDPVSWKEHLRNVTETKDAAVADWPTVNQKISVTEGLVNDLLSDPKAALDALQTWRPTEGRFAPYLGPNTKVEHAALILKQLKAGLAAESLSSVKNMRNLTEFNTLASAVTAALDAGQSEEGLTTALKAIKGRLGATRSIARQQAGMPAEDAPTTEDGKTSKRKKYNIDTGDFE